MKSKIINEHEAGSKHQKNYQQFSVSHISVDLFGLVSMQETIFRKVWGYVQQIPSKY